VTQFELKIRVAGRGGRRKDWCALRLLASKQKRKNGVVGAGSTPSYGGGGWCPSGLCEGLKGDIPAANGGGARRAVRRDASAAYAW
jgi:hypothetical protein